MWPQPGLAQVPAAVTNLEVTHAHGHLTVKFTAPAEPVSKFVKSSHNLIDEYKSIYFD